MAHGAHHKNLQLINYSLGCGQLIFYSNNDNEQTEDVLSERKCDSSVSSPVPLSQNFGSI